MPPSQLPTLTVVMPNYNHSRFLRAAILAIVNQTHRPDKFVIVDDASTDNSWDIITELAAQFPFIEPHRNEVNRGVVDTLQRGAVMAQTELVFFAGADDLFAPDLFLQSLSLFRDHPNAGLCSTLSVVIDEEDRLRYLYPSPVVADQPSYLDSEQVGKALRRYGQWWLGNTTIYRRTALLEVGNFRDDMRGYTDGFVHVVLAARYGTCFVPEPLGAWRIMHSGVAMTTGRDIEWLLRAVERIDQDMITSGKGAVPAAYRERWGRQWRFFACLNVNPENAQQQRSELLSVIGNASILDNVALSLVCGRGRLKRLLLKIYLGLRLYGLQPLFMRWFMKFKGERMMRSNRQYAHWLTAAPR